jgi:hypothetical protein
LALEDGTDMLSRNVGKGLSLEYPRTAQTYALLTALSYGLSLVSLKISNYVINYQHSLYVIFFDGECRFSDKKICNKVIVVS